MVHWLGMLRGLNNLIEKYEKQDVWREICEALPSDEAEAYKWLITTNRLLAGKTPLDTLGEGGFDKVLEAALAWRDGAYV